MILPSRSFVVIRRWLACLITVAVVCGSQTALSQSTTEEADQGPGLFGEAGPKAPEGRFVDRVYRDGDGEHKYVVFEPVGYSPEKKWPLVFYLHGASGRGRDGRAQLVVGLGPAVKTRAAKLPFLVVFPQNENLRSRLLGGWTDGSNELDRALKILGEVEQTYSVDRSHEVLVGVSMGAFGAWSVAAQSPDRWKAVIAVSGGGEPGFIPALTKVPIWAFHAADDQLVPPIRSSGLVADINAAGGRSFVSIVPTGGHNIGAAVLARDEVFEWLEHPERDPKTDIDWSQRQATASMIDEIPFIPGADVASAARIRINRDLMDTLSFMVADQIPTDILQGWKSGRSEQQGFGRSTVVGGTYYSGHVERAWITPLESGHLRVQIGIRNMAMTISDAQVLSPLMNAQAGPMTIYIGYHEPVWLSMDVLPEVVDRRVKLNLAAVHFEIPPHNWSVTRPDVSVRPLPLFGDRIADRLVSGVDQKKGSIEQSFRDKIPQMLAQMEARLAKVCERTVTYRQWPMPLWQPRFRFYPETIKIDQHGLELTLGATVAALAPKSPNIPIQPFPAGEETLPAPADSGLDVAVSLRLIDGYASMLSASDVARFHVLDMNATGLRQMGTHEFWNSVLPPDRQLDAATELNTEFVIVKPFALSAVNSSGAADEAGLRHEVSLDVPQLQLQMASRKQGMRDWTDQAAVNLSFSQTMRLAIQKPGYSQRKLQMDVQPISRPVVDGRWLVAGEAVEIDTDKIARQFQDGWSQSFGARDRDGQMKDVKMGQLSLRWDELGNTKTHLVIRLQRPGIRVHNRTSQPIDYQVRAIGSAWSNPLHLEAEDFHEFHPASAMTLRTGEKHYTLPLGFEAQIRKDNDSGETVLYQWFEGAK